LSLCEEAEQCCNCLTPMLFVLPAYETWCSVVLSSKFMPLFDNYIQTVFGFLLLQAKIVETMRINVRKEVNGLSADTTRPFVVVLSPIQFILYVKMRCLNNWTDPNGLSCRILKAAALISLEAWGGDPRGHEWKKSPPPLTVRGTHYTVASRFLKKLFDRYFVK